MRVIAGKARRLNLKSTPGLDTRPTGDRIKETLFNIIQPRLQDCVFLDLFSGSGSIGIEALSRGARVSFFVEHNAKAVRCINENLSFTGLSDQAVVIHKTALNAINEFSLKKHRFDLVYLDPPYQAGLEGETLNALAKSGTIDADTLIIIETDKYNGLDFLKDTSFETVREKAYKNSKHVFIRLKGAN